MPRRVKLSWTDNIDFAIVDFALIYYNPTLMFKTDWSPWRKIKQFSYPNKDVVSSLRNLRGLLVWLISPKLSS